MFDFFKRKATPKSDKIRDNMFDDNFDWLFEFEPVWTKTWHDDEGSCYVDEPSCYSDGKLVFWKQKLELDRNSFEGTLCCYTGANDLIIVQRIVFTNNIISRKDDLFAFDIRTLPPFIESLKFATQTAAILQAPNNSLPPRYVFWALRKLEKAKK